MSDRRNHLQKEFNFIKVKFSPGLQSSSLKQERKTVYVIHEYVSVHAEQEQCSAIRNLILLKLNSPGGLSRALQLYHIGTMLLMMTMTLYIRDLTLLKLNLLFWTGDGS